MTINRYIELLDGLLARSGQRRSDYATANYYYLAGATVGTACAALVKAREHAVAPPAGVNRLAVYAEYDARRWAEK